MRERVSRGVGTVLGGVIVACLALMSVLVFGNVVLRYGFNSGIAWSEELARLLFVWLIFLGAVLAARERMHIGFDGVLRALPPAARKACRVFTASVILACCAFFVIGGWQQTEINSGNTYPVLGISYAWLYASAIVFGIGMGLCALASLRDALRGTDAMDREEDRT